MVWLFNTFSKLKNYVSLSLQSRQLNITVCLLTSSFLSNAMLSSPIPDGMVSRTGRAGPLLDTSCLNRLTMYKLSVTTKVIIWFALPLLDSQTQDFASLQCYYNSLFVKEIGISSVLVKMIFTLELTMKYWCYYVIGAVLYKSSMVWTVAETYRHFFVCLITTLVFSYRYEARDDKVANDIRGL